MKPILFTSLLFLACWSLSAQVDARLFQYPDVSDTHITFSYGGDIWTVSKEGGVASRLSSAKGNESFPRFSPDGSMIAFSGNYDGNVDIYALPALGGVPTRVTHHGMNDRLIDWYPDGKHLLYASSMKSEKQRFSQFYKIPVEGGLPDKLPLAHAEFGSLSADGKKIAFTDRTRIFRSWKRYAGGMAADIWIFDLETYESTNITDNTWNDELPMWIGDKIFFLSDQGPNARANIWVYDTKNKTSKQVTTFKDVDVHFPANGSNEIVFEAGGKIHLLDAKTLKQRTVDIQVGTDLITIKARKEKAERYMQNMGISPDGKRAIVEARGEIFSLPAEKGIIKNLTRTSGVAERFPAWSPSGRYIAYWTDKTGEYELAVRDMKEGAKEKILTELGPGFRYNLYWSPDSKKLAFVDQSMSISIYNMDNNTFDKVDQDLFLFEGGLRGWEADWSPDSKWLAFNKSLDSRNEALFIYNTETKKLTQATKGFYSDFQPTFDPSGDYMYIQTNRTFNPIYSDYDNSWSYPNATSIAMITLRDDVASPLSVENDTVAIKVETAEADKKESSKKEEEEFTVGIDFENFERRVIPLPPKPGNVGAMEAVKGKVIYMRYPNSGSGERQSSLMYFDLKDRKEKKIMDGVQSFQLSADGKKLLVRKGGKMGIINVGPNQSLEHTIALDQMEMTVNPREEWTQIFNDAWRFQRDFFYDNEMHGVNWDAKKEQYGKLIQYAMTRNDLNYILGELIGELDASHTYKSGGDQEYADRRGVGYLGVDWAKDNGEFKIKKIIRGADWDTEVRSPLDEPGIAVKEGDYILAVNGISLSEYPDPWAAFEGLAGETVELTVSSSTSWEGARNIVIKTMRDETRLRNLAWIEANRKRVEEASGGKLGYIYVPSTGIDGQNELVRQFYGQWNKEGLVIDERFNNGGQIPDRFIELLNRKPLAYWSVRDGKNWQWPPVANFGAMAMLTNGWSGSGGDAFPDYFRKAGLGPLIGSRTWGGLIGISGAPTLIDGGSVTVPTFRMYNPDGTWFKEGYGVQPDIEIKEDPTALAKGIDPQLEKAIENVMQQVKEKGPIHPKEPAKEDRSKKRKVIKP